MPELIRPEAKFLEEKIRQLFAERRRYQLSAARSAAVPGRAKGGGVP